ncbi:MAG: hypothetical protein AB1657_05415 [Candidatus Micrarchaeota archaeon]
MRGMYVILILSGILLLSGCLGRAEPPPPAQEGPNITVISAGTGGGGAQQEPGEEDLMRRALEEQDAYLCLRVAVERQDECILPLSNLSLQNCLMLNDYAYEKECLWRHARAQDDMSICDLMRGDDVQECVRALAPPCSMETGDAERGRCLAFLNDDYNYCRDEQCFFDFGTQNMNASACGMVANEVKKAVCTAVVEGGSPCGGFEGSDRDLCYYMMAVGKNSSNYCYNIDGFYNTQIAYQCFLHFALQDSNKDLCSAVGLLNRWNCYSEYAIEKYDISACDAVDTRAEASRNLCFDGFAREFFQASACNQIAAGLARTNCYAYVVMAAQQLEFWDCNNVADAEWRDRCFTSMAGLGSDVTYCNYVQDPAIKEICLSKA